MDRLRLAGLFVELWRDNLDENGASIWMRRGAERIDDYRWPRFWQAL